MKNFLIIGYMLLLLIALTACWQAIATGAGFALSFTAAAAVSTFAIELWKLINGD